MRGLLMSYKKPINGIFNVLVIDGGGIRGYYVACLLQEIERLITPNKLNNLKNNIHLAVGTSTGSIICTGILNDVPLENISNLYRSNGKKIFQVKLSSTHKIIKFLKIFQNFFPQKNKSIRGQHNLKKMLDEIIKDCTLSEIYDNSNIGICIPSIVKNSGQPYIFKTPHLKMLTRDLNIDIKDACLASSAAPLYFPPYRIENKYFIDGGLCCNNPINIALLEAMEIIKEHNLDIKNINVLHIDTLQKSFNDMSDTTLGIHGVKDILELQMLSNSKLNSFLACFIANRFQQNYKINIKEIHAKSLSEKDNRIIQLDNCDEEAFNRMKNIATETAQDIYGKFSNTEKDNWQIIGDFFKETQNATKCS